MALLLLHARWKALEAPQRYLRTELRRRGIEPREDGSGVRIGRKYARLDELGVPFVLTLDQDTLSQGARKGERWGSVTLRERDTMEQIRIPLKEVVEVLEALLLERIVWAEVKRQYPLVTLREA